MTTRSDAENEPMNKTNGQPNKPTNYRTDVQTGAQTRDRRGRRGGQGTIVGERRGGRSVDLQPLRVPTSSRGRQNKINVLEQPKSIGGLSNSRLVEAAKSAKEF